MTILEAWSNRGLLAPEIRPIYRITFGTERYIFNTVEMDAENVHTAKQELKEKWETYARKHREPIDSVIALHCIGNRGL